MRSLFAPALACLAIASTSLAQRPSSWVAEHVSGVPSAALNHLGKILWFVNQGTLHVFSAPTRSWTSMPVSATAAIRNTNDFLLVVDGTSITALGSARGRLETITLSQQAFIVNQPNGQNDGVLMVLDGTTLSWFTGFTGRWRQRPVTATAGFSVQRNTALIVDGARLEALSALFDTWIPQTAAGAITRFGVGDTVGWASDGNNAYGFSAIRNTWATAPLPAAGPATPSAQNDVAIWSSATELLGFSGVRGRFDLAASGEATTVSTSDHLGYAASADKRRHWFYSVGQGLWTTLQTAQPVTAPQLSGATALLREPTQVHGYSALTAGISTVRIAATATGVNTTVAAALDGNSGDLRLFSAFTQSWHFAPLTAQRQLPALVRGGALLSDGSRQVWAFSARSARFVARTTGTNPTLHTEVDSSPIAVEDDGALAVFEPRREIWLTTPLQSGARPLNLAIWRTTLVATTSTEAIGFGVLHGVLERVSLPGPATDMRASSEVGGVLTSTQVLGFSTVSDMRSEGQFPEFRRMLTRGATFDLKFVGAPGAAVGALLSVPSPFGLNVGGFGEFVLDPSLLIPLSPGVLDSEGLRSVGIPIPDVLELTGLEFGFQALFAPPVGQPYLSRMGSIRVTAVTERDPQPVRAARPDGRHLVAAARWPG